MPANAEDVAVLRVVVRDGFSAELGDDLVADVRAVCAELRTGDPSRIPKTAFSH
jgi:glutamate decarboxylase